MNENQANYNDFKTKILSIDKLKEEKVDKNSKILMGLSNYSGNSGVPINKNNINIFNKTK
jgi:hypothetical protein